jgi:GNAT superfamily N-acetyltransferase
MSVILGLPRTTVAMSALAPELPEWRVLQLPDVDTDAFAQHAVGLARMLCAGTDATPADIESVACNEVVHGPARDYRWFVVVVGDEIVAAVSLTRPVPGGADPANLLSNFYIDRAHAGRGMERQLLSNAAAVAGANGTRRVYFSTEMEPYVPHAIAAGFVPTVALGGPFAWASRTNDHLLMKPRQTRRPAAGKLSRADRPRGVVPGWRHIPPPNRCRIALIKKKYVGVERGDTRYLACFQDRPTKPEWCFADPALDRWRRDTPLAHTTQIYPDNSALSTLVGHDADRQRLSPPL